MRTIALASKERKMASGSGNQSLRIMDIARTHTMGMLRYDTFLTLCWRELECFDETSDESRQWKVILPGTRPQSQSQISCRVDFSLLEVLFLQREMLLPLFKKVKRDQNRWFLHIKTCVSNKLQIRSLHEPAR